MQLPSILTPDLGTLFWMLLAFLLVFGILAKYGFPVIINMVDERKNFIDESLKSAREANEKLANIKTEGEKILNEARQQQAEMLQQAMATRDSIIREAREQALAEGQKILDEAKAQIAVERENALHDIRSTVAHLSVKISEKALRRELGKDDEQEQYIIRLFDEMTAKS